MDRRPPEDGSPGRIIATMVGIVGILLLGSLFWSALGSLLGAFGQATQALPVARPAMSLTSEPTLTLLPVVTAVATAQPTALPTLAPTAAPTVRPMVEPTPAATLAPTAAATAAPTAGATPSGRSPWVLLPLPAPGSKVAPGSLVVEARARGDSPIAQIQLELDGSALNVNTEQRAENTWRGAATVRVSPGAHNVRAIVVDAEGRRGAYRWSFEAAP